MSERQKSPYDSIAGRWLVLVERRQQNFIELCNSGRWRHYYTQAQFIEEMRKVLQLRDQWARLAGLAVSEQTDFQQPGLAGREVQQEGRKHSDQGSRSLDTRPVRSSSRQAGEGKRRPASAILAALAGRL